MFYIILTVIIFALSGRIGEKNFSDKSTPKRFFLILLLSGFILRILSATLYPGHQTDINDFLAWSDMLFSDGIPAFYASDSFTDYPPGYMYILWVIGFIKNTFHISGAAELILIKFPAIAADLLTAVLLYHYSQKKDRTLKIISALFIFNPAIILNSSVWGQVDSVFTLIMISAIILFSKKRTSTGYFMFALAIFVKPQACMFAPLAMFAFWENIRNNRKNIAKNIAEITVAAILDILLAIPFGIKNVICQYTNTLGSYPYMTVNAFNFWAAAGKNWDDVTISTTVISIVFLILITLFTFYILSKNQHCTRYFYAGAFLCFCTFMLSLKMHERYAYPAIAMILFAFAEKRDLRHFRLYMLLSLSQLFNTAYVLFVYETNPSQYYKSPVIVIASLINIFILLYLVYSSDKLSSPIFYIQKSKSKEKTFLLQKSKKFPRFTKCDFIVMFTITFVYAAVAFYALGDLKAPQNEYLLKSGENIKIEFKSETYIHCIKFFSGAYPLDEKRVLNISLFDSDNNPVKELSSNDSDVFFWNSLDAENTFSKYAVLSSSDDVLLKEMAFVDENGKCIPISNSESLPGLFDEQELVPEQETYMNSTYFDEIYHARTGYEFIHKMPVYEWTHPPLGKIFISLGIRLFGMTPFGWRFAGTLFGVLMVPVIYIFAKLLLKKTHFAALAGISFAFDFMHFVQTRIATIDVYVTFFIILMYLFMYIYSQKSFFDTPFKKTLIPLMLCGISTGCAIACKWTGIYAALGIALIFFFTLIKRIKEYIFVKKNPYSTHYEILNTFPKYIMKTLIFCCIFFIAIPVIIYALSYIPYLAANGENWQGILKNQIDIFTYHSKTVVESTHPYSSSWYTWPFMFRPIWYYSNSFENGLKAGISAFGNPLVWWVGIFSAIFCLVSAIQKKDKTALFLLIAYAANFLPWVPITRTTFIYHYFPSVPFIVLMNCYSFSVLSSGHKCEKFSLVVYITAVIIMFAAFYPVLSGIPVNPEYVSTFLRWFSSWTLI